MLLADRMVCSHHAALEDGKERFGSPRSLDPALSLEAMTPHVVQAAERISRHIGWSGEEASEEHLDAAE